MDEGHVQLYSAVKARSRFVYNFLARNAFSAIMFGALFCTLGVKFYHAYYNNLLNHYFSWILSDISVLLIIEVIFSLIYFRWPRRLVFRIVTVIAAFICTWSVINAAWLIRTGTQTLPSVILPLFRDPVNAFAMVGINLTKMPLAAITLLGPSAVALTFFFFVLVKPAQPKHNYKLFAAKVVFIIVIVLAVVCACFLIVPRDSIPVASIGLRCNAQLRALTVFLSPKSNRIVKDDFVNAKRKIPAFDEIKIPISKNPINHNIVIIVLEGVHYRHTSLYSKNSNLTPFLIDLAREGVEFTNFRSSLTHTTKALFSLLTGIYPSPSQDIAETVPVSKPYANIVTILKRQMGFRAAFFQSAKGNFECRPGLVHNLGFDKFWARDDLGDPNMFIGYLACDEFSMLKPIVGWIKQEDKPFLLTVLCSVTHDPYEVPEWFGELPREPIQKYRQAVSYTDKFIAALHAEVVNLGLKDKTIFCVVGDHGEAFGEHGLYGHERIAFEEVLKVPCVISAPFLVASGTRVNEPVSSVDFAVTLLSLLGFDVNTADFDGINALGDIIDKRKVFFSGWIYQSPLGFIQGDNKFMYDPAEKVMSAYNLRNDPFELVRIEMAQELKEQMVKEILTWRKAKVFRIAQKRRGEKRIFDSWLCTWVNRVSRVKYDPKTRD
ncbi:MAG: LTA synthase family protein [Planctomycetota bacterium]|jgi:glucan phosphoethanolaminetransferase (alkaline phosphatase superfamily)